MTHTTLYFDIAQSLAVLFGAAGAVQLAGPGFVQRAYERWELPRKFYRVTGLLELAVAFFLANAETRIWGVFLGAVIMFFAVVTLLKNGQYGWAASGMLLLASLAPASLAVPF